MSYIYFSAKNLGFYHSDLFAPGDMPADAAEISADTYRQLLDGQAKGKIIAADKDGKPVLQDPPPAAEPFLPLSAVQIRLWMQGRGETDADIEEIIDGLNSPLKEEARIKWQYATYFERGSQFIADLAKAMGWTPDWLDEQWRQAAKL